jgi:CheY-like chemotaxis protein
MYSNISPSSTVPVLTASFQNRRAYDILSRWKTFRVLGGNIVAQGKEKTFARLILLVEDDDLSAEVLTLAIKQETSCRVHHAWNGQEALRIAQECIPDLVLLDVELPGMDGLEVYDRLHALPGLQAVPVLFLTASSQKRQVAARQLPLLEKPYDLEVFLSTMYALLDP